MNFRAKEVVVAWKYFCVSSVEEFYYINIFFFPLGCVAKSAFLFNILKIFFVTFLELRNKCPTYFLLLSLPRLHFAVCFELKSFVHRADERSVCHKVSIYILISFIFRRN